jgi:MoxR-like ATPase
VEYGIYNDYLAINDVRHQVHQVLTYADVIHLQEESERVYVHPEIVRAIVNISQATRKHPDISVGCSTRGGIILIRCLKSWAMVNQRNYVTEDDIRALAHVVLQHRMIFRNREGTAKALQNIVDHEIQRLSKVRING